MRKNYYILAKILGVAVFIVVVGLTYYYSSKKSTTNNFANINKSKQTAMQQEKIDFFRKYNLFYVTTVGDFLKNGDNVENGGGQFTSDFLYSDGSILSSYSDVLNKVYKGQGSVGDVVDSSVSQNDYKLFFQGNVYGSSDWSTSVLRDGDYIYYKKCLKVEFIKASNGNRCVDTALYSNNDKVDEGGRPTDVYISTGVSNIDPLFIKNGVLYYGKMVGEKYEFYSYNPINKQSALFKPELFGNNENELLGILDNEDIVFDNSIGIFKNSLQSKVIDRTQIGDIFNKGEAIGNNYYYFNIRYDQKSVEQGHDLFKDDLLITKVNSTVYGRIINPDQQDCHFSDYIYGFSTPMYCINKEGTIVRLDSKTNTGNLQNANKAISTDVVYIINNDLVDFSRFWTTIGNLEKSTKSVSLIFDEKGNVSSLVIDASDEKSASNIYLAPYLGDGKIGEPQILVSNANLFGVTKK